MHDVPEDRPAPTDRPSLPRRDALKLLGGAGLVAASGLGLASAQTGQTPAPAAPAAPVTLTATNGIGFYRVPVGSFFVTILTDGQTPPGPLLPNFGANPDRQEAFQAALREAFINPAAVRNNFTPMLIDTGRERVLIDTGLGASGPTTGRLLANLAAAGYRPEDVTVVFLTHGHGDHIGGVTRGGQPVFPNARLVMGEREFNFWVTQAQPNAAVQANLIALRPRFTLVGENAEIVPGVTTVPAYGHTPGQLAVLVQSGGQQLMHLADAGGHHVLSFRFPDHYLGFDADKPTAVATRNRLFDRAVTEGIRLVGYHWPWPALANIRRAGNAYEYVPVFVEF